MVGLLGASCAYGQKVNGTIVGTITDSSGSVVPAAKVTLTEVNTGVIRNVVSDDSGYYAVPNLPPGTYQVAAQKQGFTTAERTGVDLFVNSTVRVDMTLRPGEVTQTVNVSAQAAPVLQTDTADTGRKIDTRRVEQLPLSTGRNFQNLLNLVPGSGVAQRDHSTFFNPQNSMASTVNGNPSLYNDFEIEGIDDNQRTNLLQIYIPPIEAVQQVEITTSNYDPQQGSALGAVTNVILKSGSNQFHGEAYEFYQGNALDTRSFFERGANGAPFRFPHIVDNYYGGNIGGPIQKGKTFFFVDYLEHSVRSGEFYSISVPTADIRGGNFIDPSLTPIYDPATGDTQDCLAGGNAKQCGTGRLPFAGNVIPASRISPVAQKMVGFVPMPNNNLSATGRQRFQNNYLTSSEFIQNTPDVDVKIDRYQGSNDHISGRFSYENPTLSQPGIFGIAGGPLPSGGIGGVEGNGTDKTYSSGINWVHLFSPTLLSEARIGVSRFDNIAYGTGYGQALSTQVGIPGANVSAFTSGLTAITGEGFSDPMVGVFGSLPWVRAGTIIEFTDNWSKVHGNHTFEWGGDYHRVRDDLLLVSQPMGAFNFGAGPTSLNGGPAASFANNFASFLLGVPSSLNRGYANIFPAYRQNQIFLYAADKWQVNPKLTLNLGLRWEYYGSPTPHFAGGFSNYNPANNTLELAGIGNVPRDLGLVNNYHNFGPRIGAAYRLSNSDVLRAGFGISYITFPIDLYAYNFPVEPTQQFSSLSSYGPALLTPTNPASFAQGFPAIAPFSYPANGIIPANTSNLLNQSYYVINPQWRNPYLVSWNLAYQRILPRQWSFDIAYVGNRGVRTPIEYNMNAATSYGAGAAGQPLFGSFGRTAGTNEFFAPYSSRYNALQVKLDHKFANGFSITTSYTYGRALGYEAQASDYVNGLLDYVNIRRNWAATDFNQTHIFNQSFTWELPFGKGRRFFSTGIPSKVLGGWELAGIWEATSGFPLNFSCNCPAFNTPGSQAFPNINGPVRKLYGVGTQPWFDTSSFSAPAPGTQGNIGPYISSGPGFFNLDASIFRRIRLTERFNLEFRSEWFHATNTPQFSNPSTTLGNSDFGLVSSAAGARVIDLAVKLMF
ncbi:MAG TPA: TonB-dependent receptor [Bryobacteraceae bacterium]|nr:TonB-dependent receptor [Bryobacteraceae bacterium]